MYCSRCGTEVQDNSKFCPSCGLDLSSVTAPPEGAQRTGEATEQDIVREALEDEYEIISELGRGGMAVVFRAREKLLDREVAIKVLPFSLAFDKDFVERFQREARTAAKLEHPHIIPIYRVGKSGRVIYFVMKFLRGTSLSDMIEKRGPLPPGEIRKLLAQTAGALGYAHKHGIVHRDIKPDNIMFDEMGHAILTDFGIAKAASGTRLTGTGMSIGTPHYMSPEQARAQPLDGRSDIYSLGVVAYQCLTGSVPFDGEDAFSIGYKHIMEEVPTPNLATSEQRQLFETIQRMMAKDVEQRFQDAAELVAVLEGRNTISTPTMDDAASAPTVALSAVEAREVLNPTAQQILARPSTPTTPMPRAQPKPPPPPKKKHGLLVASVVIILLGGGGAGGWYYYTNVMQTGQQTAAGPEAVPTMPATDSSVSGTPGTDTATGSPAAAGAPASSSAPSANATKTPLPDSGMLVVTGLPVGGRIYLDDKPQSGTTVHLGIGSYRLVAKAKGYANSTQMVTIGRGDTLPVKLAMTRAAAAAGSPVKTAAAAPKETKPAPKPTPVKAAPAENVCAGPSEHYNRDNTCYTKPPRLLDSPIIALDATIPGNPAPVVLWVKVPAAGGKPTAVAPADRKRNSDPFQVLAVTKAYQDHYQPAEKDGKAVDGWFKARFVGIHQ